jgi:uncharacterized protein (TIGR03382 family)
MNRVSTLSALALALTCLGVARPAYAHFKLGQPASWANQSEPYGDPQKSPPCGNEGAVQTNQVTEYTAGETIPITITETVMHPGHYRVALAADQASLPPAPPVTADQRSACGTTTITQNPQLPILADGLLVHTTALVGPQTVMVTLPPGRTCERCVLQVIEFMSDHGAPCYYYHCANVKIVSADGTDAGVPIVGGGGGGGSGAGGDDAGVGNGGGGTTSGGCNAPGGGSLAVLGLLAGLVALRRRR